MNLRAGPPFVIAHRGASGYLPEHTREAKALAYGLGADYLEQDVVAARDGTLVVMHDLHLDDMTDVADRFPGRARRDGRHYVIDFDWEELASLRVHERRRPGRSERVFEGRFDEPWVDFRLVRLDDELRFVRALNRTTGRRVGVYPEIKHPGFHRDHGVDLAVSMLAALADHGYDAADSGAVVQCFDAEVLRRCRVELGTRLPLAQLVEAGRLEALGPADLERIAGYAAALAPHHADLVRRGNPPEPNDARDRARRAGLALHPYTFRRDQPPMEPGEFEALLEFYFTEVGVEAVFCDQPDAAVRVRDRVRATRR